MSTTKKELIELTCAHSQCESKVYRLQSKINKCKKTYCSRSCARKYDRERTKYGADALKYVQDNVVQHGFAKVAAHFKVTEGALRRQISKWRDEGEQVPFLRKKPVGFTDTVTTGGRTYTRTKTDGGWISTKEPRQPKPKVVHIKREPEPKKAEPVKQPLVKSPKLSQQIAVKPKPARASADSLPNMLRLEGTKKIFIAEHHRQIAAVERKDSKTFIIHHKKTA